MYYYVTWEKTSKNVQIKQQQNWRAPFTSEWQASPLEKADPSWGSPRIHTRCGEEEVGWQPHRLVTADPMTPSATTRITGRTLFVLPCLPTSSDAWCRARNEGAGQAAYALLRTAAAAALRNCKHNILQNGRQYSNTHISILTYGTGKLRDMYSSYNTILTSQISITHQSD